MNNTVENCIKGDTPIAFDNERISKASLRMSQALFNDASIKELMIICEEEIGNPMFFTDLSGKNLMLSNPELAASIDDELMQSSHKEGFVNKDLFDKYDYKNYLQKIMAEEKAFISISGKEKKKDRIVSNVIINGYHFGWMISIRAGRAYNETDCKIVDILVSCVKLQLERTNQRVFSFSRIENLIFEMLCDKIESAEEFWSRAEFFGMTKEALYRVAVIGFNPYMKECDTDASGYSNTSTEILAYRGHMRLALPTIPFISDSNTLIALIEDKNIDYFKHNIVPYLEANNLICAISDAFEDIMKFNSHLACCRSTLRIAPKFDSNCMLFSYSDYSMYHLISKAAKKSAASSSISYEYNKLIEYDKTHNTDYVETLNLYLKYRNSAACAEEIHIHRNTMNYRLLKIKEITGLDFEKDESLYKLWLAKVINFMNRSSQRTE